MNIVTDEEIIEAYMNGIQIFPEHRMVNPKHDEVIDDRTEHKPQA